MGYKIKFRNITLMVLVTLLSFQSGYAETEYGNPLGNGQIPQEGQALDVSEPDHIIGTGTPESCTSEAFVEAVAKGGTIVFNGGNKPFTLTLKQTAKVFNNANPDVVIDGGGLVTLSGGGKRRILYMNTADKNQVWTTDHADNQDHPRLTVQNITFADGNSESEAQYDGGGAIWVRGGRFKVINCQFIRNRCKATGPDVGGGAIRVFDQYNDLPVYVVNSTFGGGVGLGNKGANGGAISSIGVSWTLINCLFSYNEATGMGGNPAQKGTLGGGSGGAIYNDGNEMTLTLDGTRVENNTVNAYGSGIFFVSNNHTGTIRLNDTVISGNRGGSWYPLIPGLSMHGDTQVTVTNHLPTAVAQRMPLLVDGQEIDCATYNIGGYTYFKLRDIAQAINHTPKRFQVEWNSSLASIIMTPQRSYTSIGNELVIQEGMSPVAYRKAAPQVMLDGSTLSLSAYRIEQSHYFRLRDIAQLLNFGLIWEPEIRRIRIDTAAEYTD